MKPGADIWVLFDRDDVYSTHTSEWAARESMSNCVDVFEDPGDHYRIFKYYASEECTK